jgi:hypothetical protein
LKNVSDRFLLKSDIKVRGGVMDPGEECNEVMKEWKELCKGMNKEGNENEGMTREGSIWRRSRQTGK